MYRVWFGRDPKTAKCIGECDTLKDAHRKTFGYLKDLGISAPYWRGWKNNEGYEVWDFGSWTQFFYVEIVGTPTDANDDGIV